MNSGPAWKLQRQTAAPLFTKNTMSEFMMNVRQIVSVVCYGCFVRSRHRDLCEQAFVDHSEQAMARLRLRGAANAVVDMQDLFYRFTLDAVGRIAFGKPLGCLQMERVEFADAFDKAQFITEKRFLLPFWRAQWCCPWERELRKCVRTLNEFAAELIAERRREPMEDIAKRLDLLSMFMCAVDPTGKPINPDDEALRDVVMNFLIAGRDTTANLLTWTLWELVSHPEAIEAIRQECETVFGGAGCGVGAVRHAAAPAYEDVHQKMKFLDACVMESLRLHTVRWECIVRVRFAAFWLHLHL